jgi:hypothetical protein
MANRIVNAVVYENTGSGIRVEGQTGAELFNNSSAKNSGYGIEVLASAEDTEVKNNIAWQNTLGEIDDQGVDTILSNNLETDPDFVDEPGNDFHLEATSDAIDAGADLSAEGVIEDHDGQVRPINGVYDIGAYEFFTESAENPSEGVGSAVGQSTVNGVGAFESNEGIGSASGASNVQGVGAALSTEGVGSASGGSAVQGFGQFVVSREAENPKKYLLRIREARIGANGIVEFSLVREDLSIYPGSSESPFLGTGQPGGTPAPVVEPEDESDNSRPGSTRIVLLDIPQLLSSHSGPGFYAAASGINDGWNGALLFEKVGSEYVEIAQLGSRAVIGRADTILASGPVTLFDATGRTFQWDDTNTVDVTLIDGVSELVSMSDDDLFAGANAIALGTGGRWEILAFGTATPLAPKRYRLSHLLRGLKGTEHNIGLHQAGDTFVKLDSAIHRIEDDQTDIGVNRTIRAVSIGNPFDAAGDRVFANTGVSLKPLAPVYHRGEEDADDNRILKWWRRSRADGLAGRDGIADPPLGEASERYEIDILNAAGTAVLRTLTSTIQEVVYTAAQQTADFGSIPSSIRFCVYQMSDVAGRGYSGCAVVSSFAGGSITPPTNIYRISVTISGKPSASEKVLIHPPADLIGLPAGLVGSRGKILGNAPTSLATFSVQKNGVQVGTISFAASATVATFSMASDLVVDNSVDTLSIVAPSTQDATMSDIGITLKGYRL